jgi:CspA family cold shock protein
MPTGKVRFFDEEKGYGFIESDEGSQVFVHANALPDGVVSLRKGSRVEFSVADGRKGPQALSIRVLDAPPSLAKLSRKPADDLAVLVEGTIAVLDRIRNGLQHGRHPEGEQGRKIAAALRKLAEELEA